MYCRNCGKRMDDSAVYCINCGTRFDSNNSETDDRSNFAFAILGFFIPIVGLILFLIYEGKKPKRAKSAGKGALIGFITKTVLSIILAILYAVFATTLFSNIFGFIETSIPAIGDMFREETTEEMLEKYVDVSFGEFKITEDGYFAETSLDLTVKNKAEKQYTYFITIEAVDENGARIETDTVHVDRLGAGQEIYLTAFEYVDREKIDQFKNATFRVLEIDKYDF